MIWESHEALPSKTYPESEHVSPRPPLTTLDWASVVLYWITSVFSTSVPLALTPTSSSQQTVRMILLNENPLWPHPMGVCSIYGRVSCKRSGCPVPHCSYLLLLSACSSGCSFTGVLPGPQVCQVGSYWQPCTCCSLSELRAPRHLPGVLTPACLSSGFTCPDSLSPLAFPVFLLLSFPP